MQKQTNSAPNFEILPLKIWKVSSECPNSKLEKPANPNLGENREITVGS